MTTKVISSGAHSGTIDYDHQVEFQNFAPRIGMDNVFTESAVVKSSEDTVFPATQAVSVTTFNPWQPTGTTDEWIGAEFEAQLVNYLAVAEVDFKGGSVTLEVKTGSSWVELAMTGGGLTFDFARDEYIITLAHPDEAGVVIFEFDDLHIEGIRLRAQNSTDPIQVGHIRAGKALIPNIGLPRSWQPPRLNVDARISTPVNDAGALLGRNEYSRSSNLSVNLSMLDYEFAQYEWAQFIDDAFSTPFFLWWILRDQAEAVYGTTTRQGGSLQNGGEAAVSFSMRVAAQ